MSTWIDGDGDQWKDPDYPNKNTGEDPELRAAWEAMEADFNQEFPPKQSGNLDILLALGGLKTQVRLAEFCNRGAIERHLREFLPTPPTEDLLQDIVGKVCRIVSRHLEKE